VISHKQGWTHGNQKFSRIHGALAFDSLKTKSRHSFVFVDAGRDTATVNTSVNEQTVFADRSNFITRFFFNTHEMELIESKGSFISSFKSVSDTTVWEMMLVYPLVVEVENTMVSDRSTIFKGLITDGSTMIGISKVTEPDKGEKSIWKPLEGYEFFLDGKSVAAVQTIPMKSQYVWIHNELDARTKMVVATGAAAIYRWLLDYEISWDEHVQ
jgi:hypothetical protein